MFVSSGVTEHLANWHCRDLWGLIRCPCSLSGIGCCATKNILHTSSLLSCGGDGHWVAGLDSFTSYASALVAVMVERLTDVWTEGILR